MNVKNLFFVYYRGHLLKKFSIFENKYTSKDIEGIKNSITNIINQKIIYGLFT